MTGFEPANSVWKADMLPLTSHLHAGIGSACFHLPYFIILLFRNNFRVIRAGIEPCSTALKGQCLNLSTNGPQWTVMELNHRLIDFQSIALPPELTIHRIKITAFYLYR